MTAGYRIEALTSAHDRDRFLSGSEPLDRYLRQLATQDIKRRVSNCFVALNDADAIAGYYTFAAASLPMADLSPEEATRLPRHPLMPAALIGRLAIDRNSRRQGLGGALVMDAAMRAARADAAIFALIVDAKDDAAAAFYEHLQFRRFTGRPTSLFLPIATALTAMGEKFGR